MISTEGTKKESTSIVLIITNITLFCFVIFFGFVIYNTNNNKVLLSRNNKEVNNSAFNNLVLDAKAVLVWDVVNQKAIYARNENAPRPLASLTKIMTAITAMSVLPKNTIVVVSKEFLAEEGDNGLYVNERWTFNNLLDFSLLVSSNDGMKSIASVAGASLMAKPDYEIGLKDFIVKMNQNAQKMGLSTMYFNNETGLDLSDGQNGGVGSAMDITLLLEYALKEYPNMMEATKEKSTVINSYDKKHIAKNTDEAITKIPNIIASKTGYTNMAGGNLMIAFDVGISRPVIITVLGSTYDGRFSDIEKLASSTMAFVKQNN